MAGNLHERMDDEGLKSLSNRNFGLAFTTLFMLIGVWPAFFGNSVRPVFIILSLCFLAAAFAIPHKLTGLNKSWMKVAGFIHIIINNIVMGFLYYIFIVPFGFIFKKKLSPFLTLKKNFNIKTYWHTVAPRSFDQQFFKDPF